MVWKIVPFAYYNYCLEVKRPVSQTDFRGLFFSPIYIVIILQIPESQFCENIL